MTNSQTTHLDSSCEPTLANLWPIAGALGGAMLSQALIGLVDTALVGQLGGLALASVSIGSYLVFILVAIITGFGTGWHSLISQHAHSHGGLLANGLAYGLFIALGLAIGAAYWFEQLINVFVLDDRINSLAAYYGQARLWGLPAIVISIAARIYWSEQGAPWQYTKVILLVHLANAGISFCLIYGVGGLPAMGAVGAGVGTSIALWLGVCLQLTLLLSRHVKGVRSRLPLNLKNGRLLLKFSWAPMLQQLMFALHLAIFLWILSQLGASVMAASFAVLNVGLLMVLPAVGLGQAALTLVGTTITTQDPTHAIKWSKLILRTGVLTALVVALCVGLMSPWLAQLLLVNRELQLLMAAALPWYAAAMILETAVIILSRLVLVAGLRKTVLMVVSCSQWLLFLPLLAWLAPSYGFMAVWWLHIGYRVVAVLILWLVWRRHTIGLTMIPTLLLK
jgi:putative MATE family efflux protein|tara:strand:- start:74 stop:1426 length:1353 start_codon:yes stop_codon:yes gene_type:complete